MTLSSTKMNNFLQRMLKKNSDESDNDRVLCDSAKQQAQFSPHRNKSNWMKKLGSGSPSKRGASPSIRSPSRPITTKSVVNRHDNRPISAHEPLPAAGGSRKNDEIPNLEKIIHEFEEGFLSPTKRETQETMKSGRFVKQIVAAFEKKYKPHHEHKMEEDEIFYEDDRSPTNEGTTVENRMDDSTPLMGRTYVIDTFDNHMLHYLDTCETQSVSYSRRSLDTMDSDTCTFAMDEDLTMSTPEKKKLDSSVRRSLIPNSISKTETIATAIGETLESTSIPRSNSFMRRERQPKIVGAFLKKPIEVEDTSIDWIPIIGKKLPRKKSFKRLLAMLTGKKSSSKSSKLYGSQINLQEEASRELQDSGYDEKSSSTSSLASLASFADMLIEPEKSESSIDRRSLTTFRQCDSTSINDNNAKTTIYERNSIANVVTSVDNNNDLTSDDLSDATSVASKKLLLDEISRSDVRLSLGPYFPSRTMKIPSKFSDDESFDDSTISLNFSDCSFDDVSNDTLTSIPPLRKHPYVSELRQLGNFEGAKNFQNDRDDDHVILRDSVQSSWKFPTDEVTYDVPRKHMSRSEPGLTTVVGLSGEIVYDVPRSEIRRRPRSSVYEDALSLKRRNAHFSYSPPASGFYAFPTNEQPHYATVKPRNTRICPSLELMRSVGEFGNFDG